MTFPEKRDRRRAAEADARAEKDQVAADLGLALRSLKRVQALENRIAALEEIVAGLVNAVIRVQQSCQTVGMTATAEQLLQALARVAHRAEHWLTDDEDA